MSRRDLVSAEPHLIFQAGEAFLNACRTLDKAAKNGNSFILKSVMAVNSALALEHFLKCLRTIESESFFKGHAFDQQYRDLQESTQTEIHRRHTEREERDEFFAKMRKEGLKTDLDSLLAMGKDTFIRFRYPFENSLADKRTVWALDDFMLDVRDIILEKHPEWMPKHYPPPR
jgi:hypothetical protein